MEDSRETLIISANLEISTFALQAIVENAKKIAGRDEKGRYRVDTAGKAGEIISRFLAEKDFDSYAENIENYKR